MVFEEDPITPPTPAIHYYHSGHGSSSGKSPAASVFGGKPPKFKPPTSSSASSSSSAAQYYMPPQSQESSASTILMKAKASLLSGGGSASATVRSSVGTDSSNAGISAAGGSGRMTDELSPISPAAMIGNAEHEPMILPPTPEKYAFPGSHMANPNNNNQNQMPQQSHLEWLQHINAMAKASIHSSNGGAASAPLPTPTPASSSVPPQQQPPVPTIYSNMSPHTTQRPQSATGTPSAPPPRTVAAAPGVPVSAAHAIQQFSNGVAIPPHRAGDMLYTHLAQLQKQPQISEAESEEKRARRLERNRESARKSRRRKKERLSHLGAKVAGLHTKLAKERQKDINGMNIGLRQDSVKLLAELNTKYDNLCDIKNEHEDMTESNNNNMDGNCKKTGDDSKIIEDELYQWMESTGPNCEVRRAVVDFQYTTLEQTLLPKYEKFLLWLTLHQEEYLTEAKEIHSRREGKQVSYRFCCLVLLMRSMVCFGFWRLLCEPRRLLLLCCGF